MILTKGMLNDKSRVLKYFRQLKSIEMDHVSTI